jgi:hypothetical protein
LGYTDRTLKLSAHTIKINTLLGCQVPVRKISIDFCLGLSAGGVAHSISAVKSKTNSNGSVSESVAEGPPVADFHSAFIAGTGVNIKNFHLGLRYYVGTFVYGVYVKSIAHSLNLTFSYAFCLNCKARKNELQKDN